MWSKSNRILLIIFFTGFFTVTEGYSQTDRTEQHIGVIMRMIGHEVLLKSADSTSLVLPIEKIGDRYKIQFENEFTFQPQELGGIIDRIIKKSNIAKKYIVEVENCTSAQVVYSYEVSNIDSLIMVPCRQRVQPKECYNLFVTLNEVNDFVASLNENANNSSIKVVPPNRSENYSGIIWSVLVILLIIVLILYLKRKGQGITKNPDIVNIGDTLYDKRGMMLRYKKSKVELSGKEADLLLLLFASENETLERELILKEIWNDEGDYVGRTLDVFVSKLRKKLEADNSIRIINIRGIGYKLVVQK